ncbi:Tat pathway signal protein [Streptomyces albidoflavus]|uniref:Tat pathway signal protein n=1 Tax=Streptomyces TaxID=1883 RepID=UPI001EE4AFB6|nr:MULTISPECIES: Tat pathway signal protein [unclassified Streptomyces]MCG5117310.1 Tat pathway signal protein [Streptomyces sp. T7(2022)]WTC05446.1 Tat pathway signal protein [Streptomyces albidoflavus]
MTRKHRTVLTLLTAVLSATAVPMVAPGTAEAATGGRVCLFLDKEGAPFAGRTYGHVAWAIRDPKNTNHWIWGATENAEGDSYTAPGKDNGSWIKGGTWDDPRTVNLRESIKRDGRHRKGYYDAYRCINTAGGDLKAAQRTFNNMKNNGYQILHNNCLTKAISIFRKYSPALSSSHLPDGDSTPPRNYFKTTLDNARGWEKARTY